jgi:formylaminopyrimidine deformylase
VLTELEQEICAHIDAHEEKLFSLLASLIRFRTPNPPGGNEVEAQTWVEARMRELCLQVDKWDVLPRRPNVVGVWRGDGLGPAVTLNGHIDVCADELLEKWTTDPYEPVIVAREMFGRGSTDMKSAIASFLYAITALQDCNVRLSGDVLLHSVMGEEAGEPGTRSAIERGHGGDFAIVGESSSSVGLIASIGVMNLVISVRSHATLHLHRRFLMNTGVNLAGANCIDKLVMCLLPALRDLEQEWTVGKRHAMVPRGASAINVFRIHSTANTFILPTEATAYLTITYLPGEMKEAIVAEVEERVREAADGDPWLRANPPIVEWAPDDAPIEFAPCDVDVDSPPIQLLESVIHAIERTPVRGGRGAITDAGWFARAGIPAVVFGPGDVEYAHAVDERVSLDNVVAHCKAVAVFLIRFCNAATGSRGGA